MVNDIPLLLFLLLSLFGMFRLDDLHSIHPSTNSLDDDWRWQIVSKCLDILHFWWSPFGEVLYTTLVQLWNQKKNCLIHWFVTSVTFWCVTFYSLLLHSSLLCFMSHVLLATVIGGVGVRPIDRHDQYVLSNYNSWSVVSNDSKRYDTMTTWSSISTCFGHPVSSLHHKCQ